MITDDYETYEDFKLVQGLIFSSKISPSVREAFTDIGDLVHLKTVIENCNYMFDDAEINIIGKILQYVKDIEDEYTNERINIINEILITLNSSIDKKEHYNFYKEEFLKRVNNKKLNKLDNSTIEEYKYIIKTSIAMDTIILLSHTSKDENINNYLNDFVDSVFYRMSIRAIIQEFPLILNNELFVSRMNKVLDNSKDKKSVKVLSKEIKKIKKSLDCHFFLIL